MKWLGLHFPWLPLEVYHFPEGDDRPRAVVEGHPPRVLLATHSARAAGVHAGQPLAAALALVKGLQPLPRRPRAETAALERAACRGGRFSDLVSLAPPQGLVLETGRSLRLFGGPRHLVDATLRTMAAPNREIHWCLAPTPEGARLLAAQGLNSVVADLPTLERVLSDLALAVLAPAHSGQLEALGLRRGGDLLALPRTGLAQRLGPDWVHWLDRLRGAAPDPRRPYRPPPRFAARLELSTETDAAEALLCPARRLLRDLCAFLQAHGGAARRLLWILDQAGAEPLDLTVNLAAPSRTPEHLEGLLRERLTRLALEAPVRALELRVDRVFPLAPHTPDLFADAPHSDAGRQHLWETLEVRLGVDAVRAIEALADYRPERAWRWCAPGRGGGPPAPAPRPPWLLPQPRPLGLVRGRPALADQPLALEPEREHIETGWWDGGPVKRDYFIACDARGERLWIFREAGRWFLQGWF